MYEILTVIVKNFPQTFRKKEREKLTKKEEFFGL